MLETSELLAKRKELLHELPTIRNKILAARILAVTGQIIQKISRSSTPPTATWYNGLMLFLIILLFGFTVSLLLGEAPTPEMILLAIWGVFMGTLVTIQSTLGTHLLLSTLQNSTISVMTSTSNLEKLHRWLRATFDLRKQFIAGLFIGLIVGFSAPFFWATIRGGFPGYGPIIGVIVIWFQAGLGWYFVFPILAWLAQLGQYHLKLYEADPSNSEVVDHLSDMLSGLVYTGALLGAIFTLGLFYFALLTPLVSILFLILVTWVPLIVIFVASQLALARIISRSKWKTLNEIQLEIETLKLKGSLVDKETLEAMNRLMDYHDRVRATRNSALDLRASLSFLNSLLLPLVAFILANFNDLLDLFL